MTSKIFVADPLFKHPDGLRISVQGNLMLSTTRPDFKHMFDITCVINTEAGVLENVDGIHANKRIVVCNGSARTE